VGFGLRTSIVCEPVVNCREMSGRRKQEFNIVLLGAVGSGKSGENIDLSTSCDVKHVDLDVKLTILHVL